MNIKRKTKHAIRMLWIHRHNYRSTLSIIVIMLTLLTVFVIGVDVITYNEYDDIIGLSPKMVFHFRNTNEDILQSEANFIQALENDTEYVFEYTRVFLPGSFYINDKNETPIIDLHFIDDKFFNHSILRDGKIYKPRDFVLLEQGYGDAFQLGKGVIVSEETSLSLFDTLNSIGKTLVLDVRSPNDISSVLKEYVVVGVVENDQDSATMLESVNSLEVFINQGELIHLEPQEKEITRVYITENYNKFNLFAQTEGIGNILFSQRIIAAYNNQRYYDTLLVFSIMFIIAITTQITV